MSLKFSTEKEMEMRPRDRANTTKEVDMSDRLKLAVATAATSIALMTPLPAEAMGPHMTGMPMMPTEVAHGITTMMCTDEVAMKNSMMSRESCDALAVGNHDLAYKHMQNKAAGISIA